MVASIFEHPQNAPWPFFTLGGMVIEARLLQPRNEYSPMAVTLGGIVIEVRLSQSQNASSPVVVTLDGMVIEVRLLHLSNALSPIAVTLCEMVTEVRLLQLTYIDISDYRPFEVNTTENWSGFPS